MPPAVYRFGDFLLDPHERRLVRAGEGVELTARYLDVLALLVREHGRLVSKERFFEEVWAGVPVSEEALTQAIRTLRRCLGDTASSPRFIETVPKHGYRFIAPVGSGKHEAAPARAPSDRPERVLRPGLAGTLGGGAAGLIGGLFYGFAAAEPEVGAASILLVLLSVNLAVGLAAGAGVGFAIAASERMISRTRLWSAVAGAGGGLAVGALVELIGLDAFVLLFGAAPRDIAGAAEGALLGGAAGLAAGIARRGLSLRRSMTIAGLLGAAAGGAIVLVGGRLMGGSLDQLAQGFANSRLRLDAVGRLFGETTFGPVSLAATTTLEGAVFAAGLVGALVLARRRSGEPRG